MQHREYVYACGSGKSEIIIIVVNNSVIKKSRTGTQATINYGSDRALNCDYQLG